MDYWTSSKVCWPTVGHFIHQRGVVRQAGITTKTATHRGITAARDRRISVTITHGRHGPARPVKTMVNMNNLARIRVEEKGNKLEFVVSLINCQFTCNKTNEVVDYVKGHDVDTVALTDTWLIDNEQNNNKVIGDVTPGGYSFIRVARSGQTDAGVGLPFEKTRSKNSTPVKTKSFECLDACITTEDRFLG